MGEGGRGGGRGEERGGGKREKEGEIPSFYTVITQKFWGAAPPHPPLCQGGDPPGPPSWMGFWGSLRDQPEFALAAVPAIAEPAAKADKPIVLALGVFLKAL